MVTFSPLTSHFPSSNSAFCLGYPVLQRTNRPTSQPVFWNSAKLTLLRVSMRHEISV